MNNRDSSLPPHENEERDVLVVEDDADVRRTLIEVLEEREYSVAGVPNGHEALTFLRRIKRKPRVILLDMMMPVMDGRQFRLAQLDDPTLRRIPVLVLTAHALAERVADDGDSVSYLQKPCDLDALLDTVERILHREPVAQGLVEE